MKTYLCFYILYKDIFKCLKKSLKRKYQYQKCSKGGPFAKFSTNTNTYIKVTSYTLFAYYLSYINGLWGKCG